MSDSRHPLPQDSLASEPLPPGSHPLTAAHAQPTSDLPPGPAPSSSSDQADDPAVSPSPSQASAHHEGPGTATSAAPADVDLADDALDDLDPRYSLPHSAHFAPDLHVLAPPPRTPSSQEIQQQLSPDQLRVLAEITAGSGITAAAQTLGIHRSTIHRWLNHDPAFRAAYNAWRQELMELGRSRLLKGSESAIDAVLAACAKGDARVGLSLLKELGVLARPQIGSANVSYAETEQELERRADRIRIARRSRKLFHDECAAFPDATNRAVERIEQLAAGNDPDAPPTPSPFPPTDPKILDEVRKIVQEVNDRDRNAPRTYSDPSDFEE